MYIAVGMEHLAAYKFNKITVHIHLSVNFIIIIKAITFNEFEQKKKIRNLYMPFKCSESPFHGVRWRRIRKNENIRYK